MEFWGGNITLKDFALLQDFLKSTALSGILISTQKCI